MAKCARTKCSKEFTPVNELNIYCSPKCGAAEARAGLRNKWREEGCCRECGEVTGFKEDGNSYARCRPCALRVSTHLHEQQRKGGKYYDAKQSYQKDLARRKKEGEVVGEANPFHTDHIIPSRYFREVYPPNEVASKSNQEWNLRRVPAADNIAKSDKLTKEAIELIVKHNIPQTAEVKEWLRATQC